MSTEIQHVHWKNGQGGGFSARVTYVPEPPPTVEELEEKLEAIIDHIKGVKESYDINDLGIKVYLRQKEEEASRIRARITKRKSLGDCAAP